MKPAAPRIPIEVIEGARTQWTSIKKSNGILLKKAAGLLSSTLITDLEVGTSSVGILQKQLHGILQEFLEQTVSAKILKMEFL